MPKLSFDKLVIISRIIAEVLLSISVVVSNSLSIVHAHSTT